MLNERDPEHPRAGGAETHVHELTRRLVTRGHEVHWRSERAPGMAANAELDGVAIERVGRGPTYYLAAFRHCRRRAEARWDVVVECLNKLPFFATAATRVPVVGLCHHLFGSAAFAQVPWPVAAGVWLLERPIPLAFRGRPLVAISQSTRDDLVARGLSEDQIEVQVPGVDRPSVPAPPIAKRAPLLVYVGRLEPYKRVDLLLEAAAQLSPEIPELRVAIVGRGSAESALRQRAGALGLADHVSFPGFVSCEERDDWLARARVCVCPSVKEGFGLTVIEANTLGTPNVVADAPGLRDSVRPGETGFVVATQDARAYAARLRELLVDDALATRFSEAALAWSARFDWDRAASAFERTLVRATTPTPESA
ncbi:MAG: glycosyltransferase family 4 protein [Myxococcota bacterium]